VSSSLFLFCLRRRQLYLSGEVSAMTGALVGTVLLARAWVHTV